jgi:hypothetical protein
VVPSQSDQLDHNRRLAIAATVASVQVSRAIDEIDKHGCGDNTLIFYI